MLPPGQRFLGLFIAFSSVIGCNTVDIDNDENAFSDATRATETQSADGNLNVREELPYRLVETHPDGSRTLEVTFTIRKPVEETRSVEGRTRRIDQGIIVYVTETVVSEVTVPPGVDISNYLRGIQAEQESAAATANAETEVFEFATRQPDNQYAMDESFDIQQSTKPKDGSAPDQDLRRLRCGYCLSGQRPAEALDAIDKLLAEYPNDIDAMLSRCQALSMMDRYQDAIHGYEQVLELVPEDTIALNGLAWLLATCSDSKVRDGMRSFELTKKACQLTDFKDGYIISTLAASYAECGDFEQAIRWAETFLPLIDEAYKPLGMKELESYKNQSPFRESKSHVPEYVQRTAAIISGIEDLKNSRLNWQGSTEDARNWWLRFEAYNSSRPELIQTVVEAIADRKATITDFYEAFVQSGGVDVESTFAWMDSSGGLATVSR